MGARATPRRLENTSPLSTNGSTYPPVVESELFTSQLEALLQMLEMRVERDALRGQPDALLIRLLGELRKQRRCFLRSTGADALALTEAGALCRARLPP